MGAFTGARRPRRKSVTTRRPSGWSDYQNQAGSCRTHWQKIQQTLMQPEVKKAGKEKIKEKARESIRERLAKGKVDADRDNRERWEREGRIAPKKKHDMEL